MMEVRVVSISEKLFEPQAVLVSSDLKVPAEA
jgi:hypothetical protein